MVKSCLLIDQGESIKVLALENSFFRDAVEDINNFDTKKLQLFCNVVFQLGDEEFSQYILDQVYDEKIKSAIIIPSISPSTARISYSLLELMGFGIGSNKPNSLPSEDVLNKLEKIKFENRGISISKHGNYMIESNTFARYLSKRLQIVRENEKVYSYDDGIYKPLEEIELKRLCKRILSEADDKIWKIRFEREYIAALKMEIATVESLKNPKHLMAFNNGYINLITGDLHDFSPECFFTNKLEYDYDPKAKAPRFERFLEEVFEKDPERITLTQEILGYLLMEDRRIHKMYILKGEGSNGKSILIKTIEELLGIENVSNTPLNKLEGRFGMQNLEGKLLNVSSENELGNKNIDTENIKAITGGDRVEIEKKNQNSYSEDLYARLIVSVNNDFSFSDTSYGILRRLLFIPFNVRFYERPSEESDIISGRMYQDTNLQKEISKELSGIFNIAFEGLQRLRGNDFVYSTSKVCEEELNRYIRFADPITSFIKDEMEIGPNLEISKPEINKRFTKWQIENSGEYKTITTNKAAGLVEDKLKELGYYYLSKKVNGTFVLEGLGPKPKQDIFSSIESKNSGQEVLSIM